MSRVVPKISGLSLVVPSGVHVEPYDAWLLNGVFSAAGQPTLDAFLWKAGMTRAERQRVLALAEALVEVGDE